MEEFHYSVGRARALEARMLTPTQLERMSAAGDFESAFAVLPETPYAENLAKLKTPFDIEELVELELASLNDLMRHLAPDQDLFDKDSPSPLIKNMLIHKIDLANIKTLLRAQALKRDKNFLEARLLEPGFIDKSTLLKLHDKTPQDIIARLNFTVYFPAITAGIEYYDKEKNFFLLEKLMDDFIVNQFKQAKYISYGTEPLVGFYLAKEAEIKTVRFILISKKNHVSTECIKERLRLSYV